MCSEGLLRQTEYVAGVGVRIQIGDFSQRCLAAQTVSGAHAVQLADTYTETEALSYHTLDFAACGRRVALAVIQHKGEHLSTEFDRVAVAPIIESTLSFVLYPLEKPVDRRAMHRGRAASSDILD